MALTPSIRSTGARTRAVVSGGGDIRVGGAVFRSMITFPTIEIRGMAATVRSVVEARVDIRVTQSVVRTIVRGRVDSPKIRVWTFTLDNHDYYVVRLGGLNITLVYDTFSKQWYVWGSGSDAMWRAYTGCNWQGGRRLHADQSDVVVGDDGIGTLYFLSPNDDVDDDALTGAETPRPFTRKVMGQVVVAAGYSVQPCFGVQLYGSIGDGDSDLTVQLEYSDDRGYTYVDAGSLTLPADAYSARVHWQSLGSMSVPGRLFRITDEGALRRVDRLEMDDPDNAG